MRKICSLLFVAVTLSAQKTVDQKLDQILKQQDQILKDQRKIRKILEEADAPTPPPASIKVDVSKSPAMGLDAAPVTLVEFTDFQCPYCAKFHSDTFPKLHELVASGKLKFVSMDFPLSFHPDALGAAEAGRCAREQKHFWEMRDWMGSNPTQLGLEHLIGHAAGLDLDLEQFRHCLATAKYRKDIQTEIEASAKNFHITGTPAFLIGKSGNVVEGQLITGALPYEAFEKAILAIK